MSDSPSNMQVPPPADWQRFERHMRDLFEAHWNATATMNGRSSQPQCGVDIYGKPQGAKGYHGVQCKGHDSRLDANVTRTELEAEIEKAKQFKPPLEHFILATTGLRDVKIQEVVRAINEKPDKPFTVEVLFWEDLLILYGQHLPVFRDHYPFVAPGPDRLHQLRPPVADFTGRQDEIDDLLKHMDQGVTISGVQGMGGVGKTELAYAIADRLKQAYPDAQLYLDLKGASPARPEAGASSAPLTATEVLAAIINSFHPDAKLPEDLNQLQGLYRSVLDGKRVLLLMDNAAGPDQLRPLCPPPTGSVLLVTSRQHFALPGLYAKDLNTLPADKACELLRTICPRIGDSAEEIAVQCGCLPLALRLAGSALASTTLDPADFANRLRDENRRLTELDKGATAAGEPEVTASLALSERLLPDPVRQRWYMLAVFPGDFDATAGAAVWQTEQDDAQDTLDTLYAHSVLEWNKETRRFRLHDLVRSFLRDRLVQAQPPYDQPTATRRFVEHYAIVATHADDILEQGDGYLTGLALFDTEWANIHAAFFLAVSKATQEHWANFAVARLSGGYACCLNVRLYGHAKIYWFAQGLLAVRRIGHRKLEGLLVAYLGAAYAAVGDWSRATSFFEECLCISHEIGDRQAEGDALNSLATVRANLGDYRAAMDLYKQALSIARDVGERSAEARALGNIAHAYMGLGKARMAIEAAKQCLRIHRELGDRRSEGMDLSSLGLAHADLGDMNNAVDFHQQSLLVAREIGDLDFEGKCLNNLATAQVRLGETRTAIQSYERCLLIHREVGDRQSEGAALCNLAAVHLDLEHAARAIELSQQSLMVFREIHDRPGEGNALGILGDAYADLGDARKAIEFYEQAGAVMHEIGDSGGGAAVSWNAGLAYEKLGYLKRAAELMQVRVDFEREVGHAEAEKRAARLAALRARIK